MNEPAGKRFRTLPPVQRLPEQAQDHAMTACPHTALVAAPRQVLDEAQAALPCVGAGPVLPTPLLDRAHALLQGGQAAGLRRIINATGIILHTNLGRAPLAPAAVPAMAAAARYCNLEFGLASREHGGRIAGIEPLLRAITGAEAGLAVDNFAAGMLLALSGPAGGGAGWLEAARPWRPAAS